MWSKLVWNRILFWSLLTTSTILLWLEVITEEEYLNGEYFFVVFVVWLVLMGRLIFEISRLIKENFKEWKSS